MSALDTNLLTDPSVEVIPGSGIAGDVEEGENLAVSKRPQSMPEIRGSPGMRWHLQAWN